MKGSSGLKPGVSNRPIKVFCSTKGRRSIALTIKSFLIQNLIDGDEFSIFGDGWEEPWIHKFTSSKVRFEKRPKSDYYGHEHLNCAFESCGEGWHMAIGDDDVLIPGFFEKVRPCLVEDKILFTGIFNRVGHPAGIEVGRATGRPIPGFWQALIPHQIKLGDFTYTSDAEVLRQYRTKNPNGFVENFELKSIAFRACMYSRDDWNDLDLREIADWNKNLARMRA